MKALESAFNQEKAEVVAYSMIVKTSNFAKVCFQLYQAEGNCDTGADRGGLHLVLIQGTDWHMGISRS